VKRQILGSLARFITVPLFLIAISSSGALAATSSSSLLTTPLYTHGVGAFLGHIKGISVSPTTGNIFTVHVSWLGGGDQVESVTPNGPTGSDLLFGRSCTGSSNLFGSADDIAVAPNGNLYVYDYGSGDSCIQEFDQNGNFLTSWSVSSTGGIAVAPNGNVYTVSLNQVNEFTSTGTPVTQWGSSGSGNGQFSNATKLAVAQNGNIYVSDNGNNRVQEFTSTGSYVAQWATSNDPSGIAVDSNNYVYVANNSSNNIQQFTNNGSLMATITLPYNDAEGNYPVAVAAGAGGFLYVADSGYDATSDSQWNFVDQLEMPQNAGILPQNLDTLSAPGSFDQINVTLSDGANITEGSITSQTKTDPGYSYPLGLVGLTFSTPDAVPGATVKVQLVFQSNLSPSQVAPRKYNASTKTYSFIPGASVTATTLNGSPALLLTYNVTDGGVLDEDGLKNGVIVDPVGLAVAATPDTGMISSTKSSDELPLGVLSLLSLASGFRIIRSQSSKAVS
jgi:hypothetical protein